MTLRLNGDSSGFTEIKAADAAGDNSIKLPASNGSANQLLQNGGTAGELQYTSAGGGLHYDSSGRLLVGLSSARSNLYNASYAPSVQFETVGSALTSRGLSLAYNSDGDTGGAVLAFVTSRGNTAGSNVVVAQNDELGSINFTGSDGTRPVLGGSIQAYVDGTPGDNVMPGRLIFSTNGGGASITPRVEIGSNGALKLLAGCPGIDFSGINPAAINSAVMTSETLDSYEEGTWTPVATDPNAVLTSSAGNYTRIGRFVYINGSVILPANNSGNSFNISGLPFTTSVLAGGFTMYVTAAAGTLAMRNQTNSATMLVTYGTDQDASITSSALSGTEIQFTAFYNV